MRFVQISACLLLLIIFVAIGDADGEGATIKSLPIDYPGFSKKFSGC
jgi:hypothetical protein